MLITHDPQGTLAGQIASSLGLPRPISPSTSRIGLYLSLPFDNLDRLPLQSQLRKLGVAPMLVE
jgi:hypothetical protein